MMKKRPTRPAKPVLPKSKRPIVRKPINTPPHADGRWANTFAPRKAGEKRYWLVKSEPEVFSFDDLMEAPGRTTGWDGVRNYAARNFLRDGMKRGDLVFFYHSMAVPQAIIGICEVVRESYPDATALDPKNEQYDPGSSASAPTWFMVDLRAVEKLPRPVTLTEVKSAPELSEMALIRIGRLSVSPVTASEWNAIRQMASKG